MTADKITAEDVSDLLADEVGMTLDAMRASYTETIRGGVLNIGDVIRDGRERIAVKTIRPTKEYLFVNTTKRYDRAAWVTVER